MYDDSRLWSSTTVVGDFSCRGKFESNWDTQAYVIKLCSLLVYVVLLLLLQLLEIYVSISKYVRLQGVFSRSRGGEAESAEYTVLTLTFRLFFVMKGKVILIIILLV